MLLAWWDAQRNKRESQGLAFERKNEEKICREIEGLLLFGKLSEEWRNQTLWWGGGGDRAQDL
jgi:hypothetical protein